MTRRRDLCDTANERRTRGAHIGAALRYARAAQSLNIDGASPERVRREVARAFDCLGLIVWAPHA